MFKKNFQYRLNKAVKANWNEFDHTTSSFDGAETLNQISKSFPWPELVMAPLHLNGPGYRITQYGNFNRTSYQSYVYENSVPNTFEQRLKLKSVFKNSGWMSAGISYAELSQSFLKGNQGILRSTFNSLDFTDTPIATFDSNFKACEINPSDFDIDSGCITIPQSIGSKWKTGKVISLAKKEKFYHQSTYYIDLSSTAVSTTSPLEFEFIYSSMPPLPCIQKVQFANGFYYGGASALPQGIVAGVDYWVTAKYGRALLVNVSTSYENAVAGIFLPRINTGSGTMGMYYIGPKYPTCQVYDPRKSDHPIWAASRGAGASYNPGDMNSYGWDLFQNDYFRHFNLVKISDTLFKMFPYLTVPFVPNSYWYDYYNLNTTDPLYSGWVNKQNNNYSWYNYDQYETDEIAYSNDYLPPYGDNPKLWYYQKITNAGEGYTLNCYESRLVEKTGSSYFLVPTIPFFSTQSTYEDPAVLDGRRDGFNYVCMSLLDARYIVPSEGKILCESLPVQRHVLNNSDYYYGDYFNPQYTAEPLYFQADTSGQGSSTYGPMKHFHQGAGVIVGQVKTGQAVVLHSNKTGWMKYNNAKSISSSNVEATHVTPFGLSNKYKVAGDSVLLTNQNNKVENGLYTTNAGTWPRSSSLPSGYKIKKNPIPAIWQGLETEAFFGGGVIIKTYGVKNSYYTYTWLGIIANQELTVGTDELIFEKVASVLPDGLREGFTYYLIKGDGYYQLAKTYDDALAGIFIPFGSIGSGTLFIYYADAAINPVIKEITNTETGASSLIDLNKPVFLINNKTSYQLAKTEADALAGNFMKLDVKPNTHFSLEPCVSIEKPIARADSTWREYEGTLGYNQTGKYFVDDPRNNNCTQFNTPKFLEDAATLTPIIIKYNVSFSNVRIPNYSNYSYSYWQNFVFSGIGISCAFFSRTKESITYRGAYRIPGTNTGNVYADIQAVTVFVSLVVTVADGSKNVTLSYITSDGVIWSTNNPATYYSTTTPPSLSVLNIQSGGYDPILPTYETSTPTIKGTCTVSANSGLEKPFSASKITLHFTNPIKHTWRRLGPIDFYTKEFFSNQYGNYYNNTRVIKTLTEGGEILNSDLSGPIECNYVSELSIWRSGFLSSNGVKFKIEISANIYDGSIKIYGTPNLYTTVAIPPFTQQFLEGIYTFSRSNEMGITSTNKLEIGLLQGWAGGYTYLSPSYEYNQLNTQQKVRSPVSIGYLTKAVFVY